MLRSVWNPEFPRAGETIERLNQCFDGGWNRALFDWYLARPFAGRAPDRIVIFCGNKPIASSVVNYRTLRCLSGAVQVGIASGSWTLPEERGRGLFSRMMIASADRALANGCESLIAFVTAKNASCRALARCGADMIPSSYLNGVGKLDSTADDVQRAPATHGAIADLASAHEGPGCFVYRTDRDWCQQFLNRVYPVELLEVRGQVAVIEKTAATDRLLWSSAASSDRVDLARSLHAHAAARQRSFFMYATGETAKSATDAGFLVNQPGFIACLPAATALAQIDTRCWDVQSGDRM